MTSPQETIVFLWRGEFSNDELTILHDAAFGYERGDDAPPDWRGAADSQSLGWVTARRDQRMVGFVNVLWDGTSHAWLQDVIVDPFLQRRGIGTRLVRDASLGAQNAGCEWLHVDFDPVHRDFYISRCGFRPTESGILFLR